MSAVQSAGFLLMGLALPLSLVAVEAIFVLMALVFISRLIQRQRLALSNWDIPFFAFILVRLGSGILSPHPELALKGLLNWSFCLAYLFTAFGPSLTEEENWHGFVRILMLAGAAASVMGIVQILVGVGRAGGFYGGYTLLATLTGTSLIIGMYHVAAGGLFQFPLLNTSLLILNAMGLSVSQCRTEWVVALLVLLPLTKYFHWRQNFYMALVVLGSLLVIVPLRARFFTVGEPFTDLSGREIVWRAAFDLIAQKPIFGHGLNSFAQAFPLNYKPLLSDPGAGDWHNLYLQVTVESGLVGLILFLWMLLTGVYLGWRSWQRTQDSSERKLVLGLLAVLGFFSLCGFLGAFLVRISAVVIVFMVLGELARRERALTRTGQ